jgi:branched-chain amino acid transport system substrate-binding protein
VKLEREQLFLGKKVPTGWLCVLLLLTVGGCTATGGTKPIIKVGLVAPFEGLYRPLGYEVLYAVKLAIRERNASGGVAGYMVELVALNDDNDPTVAAQRAREMAVDPDVVGVIGHFSSPTTLAALEEYRRAGLALVTSVAAANALTDGGYPNVYRVCARNDRLGREAARYAVAELGAERLAILRDQEDLAEAFALTAASLGAMVVSDVDADQVDWSVQIAAQDPDLVFFTGDAVEGAGLIVQARQGGVDAPFMGGGDWGSPKVMQIGGTTVEGILYVTSAPALEEIGGTDEFVTGYEALAGQPPGPQAVLAYDAMGVLLEAISRAIVAEGKPSRMAVIAQLGETHFEGLTGPIAFDVRGDRLDPVIYVYRIEAGNPYRPAN